MNSKIIFLVAVALSWAQASSATVILNYGDLNALAKAAMSREVDSLNEGVHQLGNRKLDREPPFMAGYKNKDLQIFQKFGKPEGMDADLLYDLCILTMDTVSAITSPKLTKKNLLVEANLNAVASIESSNKKLFGLIEGACLNSKKRFTERLTAATSKGTQLSLSSQLIKQVSGAVFFPSDFAKPSLRKKLMGTLPYINQGALIIGSAISIVGIPMSGIWMGIAGVSDSGLTLKTLMPGPDAIFKQKAISAIDIKNGIRIDLDSLEKTFLQ